MLRRPSFQRRSNMARPWAVILGASSGFGAATGAELARAGFDIFGVHLDRRGTQGLVDAAKKGIEDAGGRAVFFNSNAASDESRAEVLQKIEAELGAGAKGSV